MPTFDHPYGASDATGTWDSVKETERPGKSASNGNGPDRHDGHAEKPGDELTKRMLAIFMRGREGEYFAAGSNAECFKLQHGDVVRFDEEQEEWRIWDGAIWRPSTERAAMALGYQTALRLYDVLKAHAGMYHHEMLMRHVKATYSRHGVSEMVRLASVLNGIRTPRKTFDQHPWLATVANGTLDLRLDQSPDGGKTALLREHRQSDMLTRRLGSRKRPPLKYEPDATCPHFESFLRRILVKADGKTPDDELIAYKQRWCGYNLTGLVTEQMLSLWHGDGQNGKRVLAQVLEEVLGDYADSISAETLLSQRYEGNAGKAELARLDGVRFVQCGENPAGSWLNENRIKILTGNDPITARFLSMNPFVYDPQFKLLMHTNHKPRIRGQDYGIWRRIKIVPFRVTIPENERDKHFFDRQLADEMPGILAWMVRGCLAWQRGGLREPESVTTATSEYRNAEDLVKLFVQDELIVEEGASELQKTAYGIFVSWCKEEGIRRPPSSQEFAARVCRLAACTATHGRGGQVLSGVRLRLAGEQATSGTTEDREDETSEPETDARSSSDWEGS